jgi:hypothetical protein
MTRDTPPASAGVTSADLRRRPGFEPGQPLPPALLYRRCDPAELPFSLCSELDEAPGLIG